MFELIIYFAVLGGDTSIIRGEDYVNGQACAYNMGVWTQNYVHEMNAKVIAFEYYDVDQDGEFDMMLSNLNIIDPDEEGVLTIVCVSKDDNLRVERL